MKKLFLWLMMPIMATANEIPAKAITKEVTVFLSGAQITAESTVMIPKGNSTIVFNDLSTQIDENSIQISGLKDASVLSILYSINYLDKKTQTAQIKKLEEDILNQRKRINSLENKNIALDEEWSLLANNKKLSSEQQAVAMDKMLSFAKYYRERSEAIKNEQFETSLAINEARSLMNRFIQEKGKLEGANTEQRGQISLKLDSQSIANLNLTLKYNVGAAGWIPNYEIKSQINQNNLQFLYKASVYQQTGDDWKDVKLTLSTGDPNIRNDKPTPLPQYLNFVHQYVPTAVPVKNENFKYNPMVKRVSGTVVDSNGKVLPGATVVVVGTNQGTQTDFDGKYTLNINQGQEIDYSYIGYKTQRIPIYASQMNANLIEENTMLESIVVNADTKPSALSRAKGLLKNKDFEMDEEITYTGTGEIKEQNQTAVVFKISKPYAIQALKKAGITNFSINEAESTVTFTDVFDFADAQLQDKIGKFAESLDENNISYEQQQFRPTESRYVDKGKRKEIIRRIKSDGSRPESRGQGFNETVEQAIQRDAAFQGTTIEEYSGVESKKPAAGNRLFNEPLKAVAEIANRYYQRAFGTKRPIEYEVKFSKDKKINL